MLSGITRTFGMKLDRIAALYGDDTTRHQRARFLFFTNLGVSGITGSMAASFQLAGPEIFDPRAAFFFSPFLVAVCIIAFFLNTLLLRGKDSIVAIVLLSVSLVTGFGAIFLTGGFPMSPALPVSLIPAMFAYLLFGTRTGMIVTLASPLIIAGHFALMTWGGITFPDFTSHASPAANVANSLGTTFCIAMVTIHIYERVNRNLRAELMAERARYAELANKDALTGLDNMRAFNSLVNTLVDEANRTDRTLAVVYLDLDDFKPINDRFGHDEGDAVLREIARRLQNCIRAQDFVARLGGDEFAIILTEPLATYSLEKWCERIRKTVEAPITRKGNIHHVGVSVGAKRYSRDIGDMETLIRGADEAMFRDKRNKQGQYEPSAHLASA